MPRSAAPLAIALIFMGLFTLSCGDELALDGAGGEAAAGIVNSDCQAGERRACKIDLATVAGTSQCYAGEQSCFGGTWGSCDPVIPTKARAGVGESEDVENVDEWDDEEKADEHDSSEEGDEEVDEDGGAFMPLALSLPADCVTNPCDPGCQVYNEVPGSPETTECETDPTINWSVGSPASYSAAVKAAAFLTPCTQASDCDSDSICLNPGSLNCAHSKCAIGEGLTAGCDDPAVGVDGCVTKICDKLSGCCGAGGNPTKCSHSPLVIGKGIPDPNAPNGDPTKSKMCDYVPPNSSHIYDMCRWTVDDAIVAALPPATWQTNSGAAHQAVKDLFGTAGCGLQPEKWQCTCSEFKYKKQNNVWRWTCKEGNTPFKTCCAAGNGKWNGTCVVEYARRAGVPVPPQYGGTCAHDPCTIGLKLNDNCDADVSAVCAEDPRCCKGTKNSWDSLCVALYEEHWGQKCPGVWGKDCIAEVEATCGAQCNETTGSCAHNLCYTGEPFLDAQYCDVVEDSAVATAEEKAESCVKKVCDARPSCCTQVADGGYWDSTCVATAVALCGEDCDTVGTCVANATGAVAGDACDTYVPATNECVQCETYDLTIGVPCAKTIPVCNRGNEEAPAGLVVTHAALNGAGPIACPATVETIAPGDCLSVLCATLPATDRLLTVPAGDECRTDNNTGYYTPGIVCGPPACSGIPSTTTLKPVSLHFALDRSPQMHGHSKFDNMGLALNDFLMESDSNGLRVSARFFPDLKSGPIVANDEKYGCRNGTVNTNQCDSSSCQVPHLAPGTIVAGANDPQKVKLARYFNNNDAYDKDNKPKKAWNKSFFPMLEGAILAAKARQAQAAGEKQAVVFLLSGFGNGCGSFSVDVVALLKDAKLANIDVYILGYYSTSSSREKILVKEMNAAAGSGLFMIQRLNVSETREHLRAKTLEFLQGVRKRVLSCALDLPQGGFDPELVELIFDKTVGPDVEFVRVSDISECPATGLPWTYYFDDPENPRQAMMCPKSCIDLRTHANEGVVKVEAPCHQECVERTYTEPYTATCGSGKSPRWTFFTYNGSMPLDSKVTITAQVGQSAGTLEPKVYELGIAAAEDYAAVEAAKLASETAAAAVVTTKAAYEAAYAAWGEAEAAAADAAIDKGCGVDQVALAAAQAAAAAAKVTRDAAKVVWDQAVATAAAAAANYATVLEAQTNLESCTMTGPKQCPAAPATCTMCPINLETKLKDGTTKKNRSPYMEVSFKFTPSTDKQGAPSMDDWQVWYTCVDDE